MIECRSTVERSENEHSHDPFFLTEQLLNKRMLKK